MKYRHFFQSKNFKEKADEKAYKFKIAIGYLEVVEFTVQCIF